MDVCYSLEVQCASVVLILVLSEVHLKGGLTTASDSLPKVLKRFWCMLEEREQKKHAFCPIKDVV